MVRLSCWLPFVGIFVTHPCRSSDTIDPPRPPARFSLFGLIFGKCGTGRGSLWLYYWWEARRMWSAV